MSFLAKLSQLKKTSGPTNNGSGSVSKSSESSNRGIGGPNEESNSLLPKYYVREEDPAIRRLKEKRRQERLKNGGTKPSSTSKQSSKGINGGQRKGYSGSNDGTKWKIPKATKAAPIELKVKPPLKKLSFEELMKQAEEKAKSPPGSGQPQVATGGVPARKSPSMGGPSKKADQNKNTSLSNKKKNKQHVNKPVKINTRVGPAAPNEKLRKYLQRNEKRREKDTGFKDDGSDLDDFIDYDEDVEDERYDYDRDEIWSIFNKGRKRRYSDNYNDYDDDDDMEANEMEVLEEEAYSTKMARREDKMEEEWIRKHEEEKKRKKSRS